MSTMKERKQKETRPYRRSTPVGRLRSNAMKLLRHARLIGNRVGAWMRIESTGSADDDRQISKIVENVESIQTMIAILDGLLLRLELSGFVPPKPSSALVYTIGQHVAIAPRFMSKYRSIFESVLRSDPGLLDDLVVEGLPPSGEIVVRRGRRTPFMAPKSHLVAIDPFVCP
jgi:hypothetical protein